MNINQLFTQFVEKKMLNEAIALTLGYYQDTTACEDWHNPDGENLCGCCRFGGNEPQLPQWDSDKNLWTDGEEVVEWMRSRTLLAAWATYFPLGYANDKYPVECAAAIATYSAQDYARAFCDCVKESL